MSSQLHQSFNDLQLMSLSWIPALGRISFVLLFHLLDSLTLLFIFVYKNYLTNSPNIVCMPMSLFFWFNLLDWYPWVVPLCYMSILLFSYDLPKCKHYVVFVSVCIFAVMGVIKAFGMIFMHFSDISGAIVRHDNLSNVMFQLNQNGFVKETFPIFISDKKSLYESTINLTRNGALIDLNSSCFLTKFSDMCYTYNTSMLDEISTVFYCQTPSDDNIGLFTGRFDPYFKFFFLFNVFIFIHIIFLCFLFTVIGGIKNELRIKRQLDEEMGSQLTLKSNQKQTDSSDQQQSDSSDNQQSDSSDQQQSDSSDQQQTDSSDQQQSDDSDQQQSDDSDQQQSHDSDQQYSWNSSYHSRQKLDQREQQVPLLFV